MVLTAADLGGALGTHCHHLPLDAMFWNGQIAAVRDAYELHVGQDPRLPCSLVHLRSLARPVSVSGLCPPRSPGRRCSNSTAVESVLQLQGALPVFARFCELSCTVDAKLIHIFLQRMYVFSWLSLYF
jgi:hypothetical protein